MARKISRWLKEGGSSRFAVGPAPEAVEKVAEKVTKKKAKKKAKKKGFFDR